MYTRRTLASLAPVANWRGKLEDGLDDGTYAETAESVAFALLDLRDTPGYSDAWEAVCLACSPYEHPDYDGFGTLEKAFGRIWGDLTDVASLSAQNRSLRLTWYEEYDRIVDDFSRQRRTLTEFPNELSVALTLLERIKKGLIVTTVDAEALHASYGCTADHEAVWEFCRHLVAQLPIMVRQDAVSSVSAKPNAERLRDILGTLKRT